MSKIEEIKDRVKDCAISDGIHHTLTPGMTLGMFNNIMDELSPFIDLAELVMANFVALGASWQFEIKTTHEEGLRFINLIQQIRRQEKENGKNDRVAK